MSAGDEGSPGLMASAIAGLTPRGGFRPDPEPARREPAGPGHETSDVDVRNTAAVMAGFGLSALAVVGIMVWTMAHFTARQRESLPKLTVQQTAQPKPPPPNLQPDPYRDLDQAREAAKGRVSGYGYVDPAHTRARIPIDRAIALTVGRPLDPPRESPEKSPSGAGTP